MADPTSEVEKGKGRGQGRWTIKGVQAQQAADIEELKALVAEMAAALDALEGGATEPPTV